MGRMSAGLIVPREMKVAGIHLPIDNYLPQRRASFPFNTSAIYTSDILLFFFIGVRAMTALASNR